MGEKGVFGSLKFPKSESRNPVRKLRYEAENWRKIWNLPVSVITLAGKKVLRMPYLTPAEGKASMNEVNLAIEQFANCSLIHNDLRWEHVGIYCADTRQRKVILFDLSEVEQIANRNEAVRMMQECLQMYLVFSIL